jgi:hypothetical protein
VGVEAAAEEEERGSLKGEVRTAFSFGSGVCCVVWCGHWYRGRKMAFGGKMPTVLEQLLEEINFQRTKEMRHLMKDGELFWSISKSRDWSCLPHYGSKTRRMQTAISCIDTSKQS